MQLIPNLNLRRRFANWRARRLCGGPALRVVPPGRFQRLRKARRVLIGAGSTTQEGWFPTDRETLDVGQGAAFRRFWRPGTVEAFCAEHVWEHLEEATARRGVENCFAFLRAGGTLRIAVPDGFHPSAEYREWVRPGGTGLGANDHKILHTHVTLRALLATAGFEVRLVEWWDESGQFHAEPWFPEQGYIVRSATHDPRNQDGALRYTSLIVDGTKPTLRAQSASGSNPPDQSRSP